MFPYVTLIVSMLMLSAFFSGSEMAFIASNNLVIEINRKHYPRITRIIDVFKSKPSILIATILVGNNTVNVIYNLLFNDSVGPILSSYISSPSLIILAQTLLSTFIVIVTAEFLPKALIQTNPSLMLNVLAVPLFFFYVLLYPIGLFMQGISRFVITKVFRSADSDSHDGDFIPGRVDLDNLLSTQTVDVGASKDVGQEARLMKNALDFSKIKVRDCFVPRTDIVAIDINNTLAELHRTFIETGFSKILVYKNSIDNIIGYVHVSEMFLGAKSIKEMMSPIAVVPETMSANLLLKQFTSQHKSIAIVVDEFGGTAGLITLEDVLEEIFGEINDEHDVPEYEERVIDEHTYLFSARLEIDYLNETYNLSLPVSDDYDTLAGLILHLTRSIPEPGQVVEMEGYEFKIVQASHAKIDRVMVKLRD